MTCVRGTTRTASRRASRSGTTPDIVTWDDLIERMFALDRQAGRLDGRWLPV